MRKTALQSFIALIFLSLLFVGQISAQEKAELNKNIGKFVSVSENGNIKDVQGASTAVLSGAHIGDYIGGAINPYTGTNTNFWAGTIKGTLDGVNTDFYCIDINHHLATDEDYTDEGPTQIEITYILNNYYPYVSFPYANALDTEKKEASAVQTAIWHFADGLDETTIGNAEIKDRVIEIIADANANANSAVYPDYFSITPANQTVTEGEVGNFVVTALDTDGNPYAGLVINLTTTSGTLSTNQVTTNPNGVAQFSIAQDGANFATITAQAHATIQHGTQYFHVDSPDDKQKLVLATPTTAISSASADINWIPANVTLGDFVWHDSNVNGIQDAGEDVFENVVIELYDNNGNLLSTTSTDANGYYEFTNLQNGDYTVKVADENFNAGGVFEGSDSEKWYITYANMGNDDTKDSNGDENNSADVTIANNNDDFTIDFGYFHTCMTFEKTGPQSVEAGDIINYTFKVINCGDLVLHGGASVYDAMLSSNEDHLLRNKIVEVGETWEFIESYTTTNNDCGDLTNNAWAIGHPIMPDGSYKENIEADDNWTVEVVCNTKATIGDRVWFDDNQDGIQDLGEDGVENVTVNLYTCADAFVATTQTDNDGYYLFEDLEVGSYYVEFVLPNDYQFSPQNSGNDSAVDSDADETTGKTVCTDLDAGEVDLTWDAGIYAIPDNNFDISIEKTASDVNPEDGDVITYTITVTNNGNVDATNITVSDVLPAGLEYQSSAPAGYDETTGVWNVGDIAAGNSTSLTITVKVDYLSMSQAPIFDLGIAAPFNLFVLKDVSQPTGSDTEGKVAVGRNAVFGNYSVGDKLPLSGGTEDVLIVGRKLTFTSGRVYSGNVVYGKYIDVPQINLCSDGSIRKENPVPVDFAQADVDLNALSSLLAAKPVTGTTTFEWGCLTLNGEDPILNVFKIDGNELSAANNLEINVPNGSVVLVNISRRNVTWTGGVVVNGTAIGNVLYNFYKARTLDIQGIDIRGSVLAPKAKVNFVTGVINGQMICKYYEGQGQMNNSLFHGSIQGNPEITNCAEITSVDQLEDNTDNNSSSAQIVVDVNLDPNNGSNNNNGTEWVEFGNSGLNEMIWSMCQGSNGLLVGTVGGNIYLNSGNQFIHQNDGMDVGYIWSLHEFNGHLYAGTDLGLYRQDGNSWTKVDIDGDVRSITSIGNTLYAAVWAGGVFASDDEGTTWNDMSVGLEACGKTVHSLTSNNGDIFAGTFGQGILKYDFANSEWVELPVGFQFIWSLTTDATGTIYAGTYGGGVYISNDHGDSWSEVNTGLPNLYIYSVSVYGNDIYLSTYASGVYKYQVGSLGKADGNNPSVASVPTNGSWTSIGMGGIEVSSVMVDESTQTLLAGTSDGTIYKLIDGTTDVSDNSIAPTEFKLEQNYPNPFNPTTIIEFSIPEAGLYSVKVFNVLGQEITTLVSKEFTPGNYTFNFDASNLTSGIYFYKLIGEKVNLTKKMMLLK